MSLISRFALIGLWASTACAQSYTVTVTETVTECALSCYPAVSQCTSTEYIDTSSIIKLPTGSSAIVSIPESPTSVTDIISLPTISVRSTSKFANTSSVTASYTSTVFGTETTLVISESTGASIGSSALAGETSSELESSSTSLYEYSTSTLTLPLTSGTATDLETMPTLIPSADSSALAPGTSELPETGESTTVTQGTTEKPSESFTFNTETIPTQGVSTDTYVSQHGSSTASENSGTSTATGGDSTTTLKSVITSQITITESISTVYTVSTEQPTASSESTGSLGTSSQFEGASSEAGQSLASTSEVTSEAAGVTQLTSVLTLTNSVIVSESSDVPQETTVVTIVASSSSYDTTASSETEAATSSTIEIISSETEAAQTDSTASGVSPQSTKSRKPAGTTEASQSISTPCTSTEHTRIYQNVTVIHSTAQEEFGSSALAGSFTSTFEGTGYASATSDVTEQTTPVAETSQIRGGISTSEYFESTGGTAIESPQTSVPFSTEDSTLLESTTAQTSSGIAVTPSQSTQAIQTPPISPSASSDSEPTAPRGYDFGNPSSINDGWPTASFASTADAATGFSSLTTFLTTSKVADISSTSTAIHEPEYEPPAYEPPSYREPAYGRKRWALRW
ncbi:hypothetical protein FHETE_7585 [Fusarium heterosporum]|uniref:Uncharacterized protein n=1 Tax=Fusarium heterosporum TaxID=42747 RepID=A0A8H5T065_FUSHE|nr:hypothetical protein FHETE_7585 [Fusarium heterosporum]